MKKLILLVILVGVALGGYVYRDEIKERFFTEEVVEKPRVLRELPAKMVEIFDLGEEEPEIKLSKSATVSSSVEVDITPQVNGKVTDLRVNIGDRVERGEILAQLGDSLNTEMLRIQRSSAAEAYEVQNDIYNLNRENSNYSLDSAEISAELAYEAYLQSLDSQNYNQDILDTQEEAAELALDAAEDGYKNADDAYEDVQIMLKRLDEDYEALQESGQADEAALQALAGQIAQMEGNLESTEMARDNARKGMEQAELQLEQLRETRDSQLDQLEFGSESSYLQFLAANNQAGSAGIMSQIQVLGNLAQLIQLQSSLNSTEASLDQLSIRSPIDGIISAITVKRENLVSPGQVLMTIEDPRAISIKTSLNEAELALILPSGKVTLSVGDEEVDAQIVGYSPSLDARSKKINIEILPDEDVDVRAGSTVKVNFYVSSPDHTFVPLNAVFLEDDKKIVKVVDDENRVQNQEVQLGQIVGNYFEIKDGLRGSEQILRNQTSFVKEGDKVKFDEDDK